MKTLLLLGGNANQKVAIERAKELGYRTVLCDYLLDNPGQYVADKTYFVSTTDIKAVLEVAQKEHVDGVMSYASDVAAPTAAYVAEKLTLPGNPYESVKTLCNKDQFRRFLRNNGFATPHNYVCSSTQEADGFLSSLRLPVIVKPVDSSSSKGSTVIYDWEELQTAIQFALSFSRAKKAIIEEFIEKKNDYLIGGDIFVLNHQVVLWGLMNCHRDNRVNPLVPVGKSLPLMVSQSDEVKIKATLERMISLLGLNNTAMNIELIIGQDDQVYLIDIGPRCGGNNIPEFLDSVYYINEIDLFIKSSMGEEIELNGRTLDGCYCTHNLHSVKNGILKRIEYSEALKRHIYSEYYFKHEGELVERFDNATKVLGIIFLKFDTQKEMMDMYQHIYDNIQVVL